MTSPPATTQTQPSPRVKPASVVYWMRFFLAIAAGVTINLLHINQATMGDYAGFVGIALGVLFYAFSVVIVRNLLHYGEAELRGKNRDVTLGGGTFIVVWIMVTVLVYTLGV